MCQAGRYLCHPTPRARLYLARGSRHAFIESARVVTRHGWGGTQGDLQPSTAFPPPPLPPVWPTNVRVQWRPLQTCRSDCVGALTPVWICCGDRQVNSKVCDQGSLANNATTKLAPFRCRDWHARRVSGVGVGVVYSSSDRFQHLWRHADFSRATPTCPTSTCVYLARVSNNHTYRWLGICPGRTCFTAGIDPLAQDHILVTKPWPTSLTRRPLLVA